MRRLARAAGAIVIAIVLGAAGPYTQRLSADDHHRIRTVAVIAALGDTFAFEHVRNDTLGWLKPADAHFLEISDWALDAGVAKVASAALAKSFTVKTVAFDPADFSSWDYSLLRQDALDLNGDPAIDAYVFILRDWRPDTIGHSVHALGGLGLYRQDRDGRPPRCAVFASYRIVVVDALTGAVIAARAADLPHNEMPWLPVDPTLWPKTPNDMTDSQRAILQAAETKLIQATLLSTLEALDLAR